MIYGCVIPSFRFFLNKNVIFPCHKKQKNRTTAILNAVI